jgi:hypothetical protein
MIKSAVVDSATGKSKDSRVRTSSGTFLARGQDKIIQGIEKRIADFTFIPLGNWKANMSMDFSKYCGVCAQQGVELVWGI